MLFKITHIVLGDVPRICGECFRCFFINKFNLSEEKVYEFVLGAIENSNIENDFRSSDHGLVIESFEKFHQSINEEN